MRTKHIKILIKPSLAAIAVFFSGFLFVQAAGTWSGPSSAPPGANTETPLNVGSLTQTKAGVLNVGGIRSYVDAVIDGNIDVGTSASSPQLHVFGGNPKLYLQASGAALVDIESGSATQVRGIRFTYPGAGFPFSIGQSVTTGGNSLGFFNSNITSGNNPLMVMTSAGNIGIGNLSPTYKLEVNGSVAASAFFYASDRNLKTNITPLSGSLSNISKLQGVSFNWKEGGEKSVGLIAQDVEKIYPELVNTNPESGVKSVQYGNLVAPLIEAIKEQQKQIDELKREISNLKGRLN